MSSFGSCTNSVDNIHGSEACYLGKKKNTFRQTFHCETPSIPLLQLCRKLRPIAPGMRFSFTAVTRLTSASFPGCFIA